MIGNCFLPSLIHIISILMLVSIGLMIPAKNLNAQHNWQVKGYSSVMPGNVEKTGLGGGLLASYEQFIHNRSLSYRISPGIFNQNTSSWATLSASLHYTIYAKWSNALNLFAGGTGLLALKKGMVGSSSFSPLGGIEFNRALNRKWDFSIQLAYFPEEAMSMGIGLRYWLSKDLRKGKPCLSCPD